jgi:hypothetical protein
VPIDLPITRQSASRLIERHQPEEVALRTYVAICARCAYEQYFVKQEAANTAQQTHAGANPTHDVRVTRVRHGGAPFQ